MNIDYKYFAGAKDPIEIINKYRMRGFGTYLNGKEKIRMTEYSSQIDKWNKLYNNIKIKSNNLTKRLFGQKDLTDILFKPSNTLYNKDITYTGNRYCCNSITKHVIDRAYSDLYDGTFDNIDGVQKIIYKTSCVSKGGYVLPFRKWLISACYEFPIKQKRSN